MKKELHWVSVKNHCWAFRWNKIGISGHLSGWSWRGHLCYNLEELSDWSPDRKGFNPRYSANVGIITTNFDASE